MGHHTVMGRNLDQDSQGFQKYFINRFVYGLEFLTIIGVCPAIDMGLLCFVLVVI